MDSEILLNLLTILFFAEFAGAFLVAFGLRMWEMRCAELELKRRIKKSMELKRRMRKSK